MLHVHFLMFSKKNFTLTKYNKLMKNIEIEFKKFKMKLIVLVDFLKIRWYVDSCNKNFNKFNTDINMIFIITKKNKKLIKLHIKNFIKNRCNICTINYLYNIFLYKIFFQFIYYSKKNRTKKLITLSLLTFSMIILTKF